MSLETGETLRERDGAGVSEIARPEVDELAEKPGEHSNLMIEEHGLGVFLYKFRWSDTVQLDRHGLPETTQWTITDRDELFETPDQVRERGHAYNDEERVKGMRCLAAPVAAQDGPAIPAVSVSGPKSRMQGDRFSEAIPEQILRSANVIEVNRTDS